MVGPSDLATRLRRRPACACIAAVLMSSLTSAALAAPDLSGKFEVGVANTTEHKPQSKAWFNDGTWWTVVYDGSMQRIWKLQGGTFAKQTYADAAVDDRSSARADVVWDGTYLYVLMWHPTTPRFSKYAYDSATQTYTRLPGFPLAIPIANTEVMVMDRDSTGRLWIAFENNHEVHAIWSTTPDHLTWNTTGVVIESNIGGDDIATVVAFGGNQIGVFWSDQANWHYGFRARRDADPPEVWSARETVDSGSSVDDHVNAAFDANGRVYIAAKDVANHINIYRRETNGAWIRLASNVAGGAATRPIIMVDDGDNALQVFYTDWQTPPDAIHMVTAPLSTGVFGTPTVYLSSTSFLNNVTGTKQILTAGSGVLALASSNTSVYWGFMNRDTSPPDVVTLAPTNGQAGVPIDVVLRAEVTDAGMGVDASSIVVQLDGVTVPFTLTGSAAAYTLEARPAAPLAYGRIYTLTISARDNAYPPQSDTATFQFKTVMAPGPVAGRINFQTQSMVPPSGWQADWGAQYTLTRGRGWDKSTISGKRGNVNPDPLLDTYVDRTNSNNKATWNCDVPNGLYRVTLVAGCPVNDGKHGADVEGKVLFNGQTTAVNTFITIADYEVAVTDGQISLGMGGIGGSKKTQLCYFKYDYVGPAPTEPPPSAETAPVAVAGLRLQASASNLLLTWDPVSRDVDGNTITVARYAIYRGSTRDFTPDRSRKTNRIGLVSNPSFTDLNALAVATDMYYYVTAERSSGTESPANSELGVRRRTTLTPPAGGTLVAWISLPSRTPVASASQLALAIQGGAAAGGLQRIARLDATTQQKHSFQWSIDKWVGTDFALSPGEAYELTVTAALGWNVIGVEAPPTTLHFEHHTAISNLNWIALPTRVAYANARQLAESLNGGTGGGRVTKIARLNPASGAIENYVFYAGAWRGVNFNLDPGIGVGVIVAADVPSWTPAVPQ